MVLTNATQLTPGGYHGCGLRGDGQAFCWGRNNWGQVGDGTVSPRNVPVPVSN